MTVSSYDSRCYDLAEIFLEEKQAEVNYKQLVDKLALEIQTTIEDFLTMLELEDNDSVINNLTSITREIQK